MPICRFVWTPISSAHICNMYVFIHMRINILVKKINLKCLASLSGYVYTLYTDDVRPLGVYKFFWCRKVIHSNGLLFAYKENGVQIHRHRCSELLFKSIFHIKVFLNSTIFCFEYGNRLPYWNYQSQWHQTFIFIWRTQSKTSSPNKWYRRSLCCCRLSCRCISEGKKFPIGLFPPIFVRSGWLINDLIVFRCNLNTSSGCPLHIQFSV